MKHLNNSLPGMFGLFLILTCLLAFVNPVAAQGEDKSLTETLSTLSQDAAKGYLLPIASAFGTDLNAGWFHRAPEATKFSFDLEIGFVAMGSFFPDDATHFEVDGSFKFSDAEARQLLTNAGIPINQPAIDQLTQQSSNVSISGATIIGSSVDSIMIALSSNNAALNPLLLGQAVKLPFGGFGDLADVNIMPLFAPQISIGTVFGTQATFRYLPTVKINDDLGDFSYFGFGFQHNPGIWLNDPLPVDVAASFFTQALKIGDLFNTTTTAFGVNASYELGLGAINLTPYAGFMFESSTMEVTYKMADPFGNPTNEEIKFELEGESKTRLTLGLSIRLLLINLNADYNIGAYNSFSAGLTFRI